MKDNALYLEVDEDITSAIDKLSKVSGQAVQIVVPKRSSMLQSIINLKLLKKAAESHHKELVLVTSDRIATELAGRVGLAIAPSLGAKAVLADTKMPEDLRGGEEIIEASDPEPPRPTEPKPAPVKKPLLSRRKLDDAPTEPIPEATADSSAAGGPDSDAASASKPSGPKVPNFNRMQRRVTWASLALVLIAGYMAFMYLATTAKVVLYANASKVSIDTTFSVDPTFKNTDKSKSILAGQLITVTKDLSGPFTPTGKKDVGTKATGTMVINNEYDTNPHNLVAGTRFQAPDGKIFRTKADATVPGATLALVDGEIHLTSGKSDPVAVEADAAGDSYNEAPAKYIIPGYSGQMQTKIYGQGSQMAGGTTKTVTVATQGDVDGAKAELLQKDKDNVSRDLDGRLPSGFMALPASQTTTVDKTTPDPAIDQEGATGSLALKVTYTVLAVKKTEYQDLVKAQEQTQIGNQNQIYDDGLDSAQVTSSPKEEGGRQAFHLTTEAFGGPKIDTVALTKQLKGQRYGDAANIAQRLPGIGRVEITLWPGWATSLPNRTDKINITIQVAGTK